MKRLRIVVPLLVIVLLVAACQPVQTQLPPTALPTTAPTSAPTALPATLAPTTAPATTSATLPVSTSTLAPTLVPSMATLGPVVATTFKLGIPWDVATDGGGNLYVSTCP